MAVEAIEMARLEATLLDRMNHENIVKLEGQYEDDCQLCLVFELMSSDLRNFLNATNQKLDENYVKKLFTKTLYAVH